MMLQKRTVATNYLQTYTKPEQTRLLWTGSKKNQNNIGESVPPVWPVTTPGRLLLKFLAETLLPDLASDPRNGRSPCVYKAFCPSFGGIVRVLRTPGGEDHRNVF